jgi:hypothetical protein
MAEEPAPKMKSLGKLDLLNAPCTPPLLQASSAARRRAGRRRALSMSLVSQIRIGWDAA